MSSTSASSPGASPWRVAIPAMPHIRRATKWRAQSGYVPNVEEELWLPDPDGPSPRRGDGVRAILPALRDQASVRRQAAVRALDASRAAMSPFHAVQCSTPPRSRVFECREHPLARALSDHIRRGDPSSAFSAPTHNRADILPRVYQSLLRQSFQSFEWLVIDNASSDDTTEVVAGWARSAPFPIRYLHNAENIGFHGSWKRALDESQGEFFLYVRSADEILPIALERLKWHWDSIPDEQRGRYSAVSGLATDEHGKLHGTRFPKDVFDSDSLEIRYRYKVEGGEVRVPANRCPARGRYPGHSRLHRLDPPVDCVEGHCEAIPDEIRQ